MRTNRLLITAVVAALAFGGKSFSPLTSQRPYIYPQFGRPPKNDPDRIAAAEAKRARRLARDLRNMRHE